MLKFYYYPAPNPAKVALFLEEAGLEYEVLPVDIRKGDQHLPDFLFINPNGKTPPRWMGTRSSSIAMRSCSISRTRRGNSCPRPGMPDAANCCPG